MVSVIFFFWSALANSVALAKNVVAPTKNFIVLTQNLVALTLINFLVGLTKNESQPDQNCTLTQPNRYLVVPILRKGWKDLQNFSESNLNIITADFYTEFEITMQFFFFFFNIDF